MGAEQALELEGLLGLGLGDVHGAGLVDRDVVQARGPARRASLVERQPQRNSPRAIAAALAERANCGSPPCAASWRASSERPGKELASSPARSSNVTAEIVRGDRLRDRPAGRGRAR